MSTTPINPGYYADFRGLDSLKKSAREHDPQAVRQAARQFESLLTSMLLKSMRQAKLGDGLGDSQETEFYQDMLDQQVAVQLSQGKGLGLADMLVQQLTRSGLAGPKATPASPATAPPAASVGAPPTAKLPAGSAAVPLPEQTAFIRQIEPYAQRAADRLGVAPEALIAHAALETGWGRHVPAGADGGSSFNLFGIKAAGGWTGPSTMARTVEYTAGTPSTSAQSFRSYTSVEQGIDDYINVLQRSPRFQAALGTGHDMNAFAYGLARGGYATDPVYGSKLAAVAEQVRALRSSAAAESATLASVGPVTSGISTFDSRGVA